MPKKTSLKICILGKYPPIEGGVSCGTYWLVRALARRGHRVFVVTNAQEAGFEYQSPLFPSDGRYLEPPNVAVINTRQLNAKFIPAYSAFTSKLAGLAIDVITKEKIDILYSNYLLPYGVAAYLAKAATGIPWFLDHAGSDITTLFAERQLSAVFNELFHKADVVANTSQVRSRIGTAGFITADKLAPRWLDKMFARDLDDSFSPRVKPLDLSRYFDDFKQGAPVFTYLGKISLLRKTFAFIKAAGHLPKGSFYLLFVTEQGRNVNLLTNVLQQHGLKRHACILPFQPPWKISAILNASTCVVCPEDEEQPYFPKGTHGSRVPLETMMCAKCAIVGRGMSEKAFYASCKDNEHFLVVNPKDSREFGKKLKMIIDRPAAAEKIGRQAREYVLAKKSFFESTVAAFVDNLRITVARSA